MCVLRLCRAFLFHLAPNFNRMGCAGNRCTTEHWLKLASGPSSLVVGQSVVGRAIMETHILAYSLLPPTSIA